MKKNHAQNFSCLRNTLCAVLLVLVLAIACSGVTAFAYNDFGLMGVKVTADRGQGVLLNSYEAENKITLTADIEGGEIYYTMDGSTPTTQSNLYSGPVTLEETGESRVVTLKAAVYKDGAMSDVSTFMYEVLHNLARGKGMQLVNGAQKTFTDTGYVHNNSNGSAVELNQWYTDVLDGTLKWLAKSTQYYNDPAGDTYVQLDLGEETTFNRLFWQTTPWNANDLGGLKVEVSSSENEGFAEVYKSEDFDAEKTESSKRVPLNGEAPYYGIWAQMNNNKFVDISFPEVTGRYVRLRAHGYDPGQGGFNDTIPLSALMLFNCAYDPVDYAGEFDPSVPVSAGKTFTLTNNQEIPGIGEIQSNSSGAAVDKNVWLSRLASPTYSFAADTAQYRNDDERSTYVQVDLGQTYLVNRFVLHPCPILPDKTDVFYDLVISVSENGEDFETVYEKEGWTDLNKKEECGNNGLNGETYVTYFEHTVSSIKARYVRIQSGEANKEQMLTNVMVFGNLVDSSGAWLQPESQTVQFDHPLRLQELKDELSEKYPSATFTSTNGYIVNYPIEWVVDYTDDQLKEGGTFTCYGVIAEGQNFPENVADPYNAAVVMTVTMVKADKTALNALISQIEQSPPQEEEYTAASWSAYEAALSEAKTVQADEYCTQAAVDAARTKLDGAYKGLQPLADKTALNAKIAEVQGITGENYITGSYNVFAEALAAATATAENASASQEEVDNALAALTAAHSGLLTKDKAQPLADAIAAAKDAVPEADEAKWTSDSWAAYEAALAAAEAKVDGAKTAEELAEAQTALENAVKALVKLGDKTQLNAAVQEAEAIEGTQYTTGSFAALADALAAAKTVVADIDATQAEVDAACDTLREKIEALVKLGDKTQLNALLKQYENLDGYTSDSVEAFSEYLQRAKNTAGKAEASEAEVAEAVADLQEGALLLVKKGDKTQLNALLAETIDTSKYTQLSVLNYQKAAEAAELVAADADATQEEVDAAVAGLVDAKGKLVLLGDKTALNQLIDECEGMLDGAWTEESVKALREALDAANAVKADSQATEDAIAQAISRLTQAKDAMEEQGGCGSAIGVFPAAVFGGGLLIAAFALMFRRNRGKNEI